MLNLKTIRKSRGLTQQQLAKLIGVTESAVGQYETDRRKPSYEVLLKLSDVLQCTVEELLGNTPRYVVDPDDPYPEIPLSRGDRLIFKALRDATEEEKETAARVILAIRNIKE